MQLTGEDMILAAAALWIQIRSVTAGVLNYRLQYVLGRRRICIAPIQPFMQEHAKR